jgi:hypothetical protein
VTREGRAFLVLMPAAKRERNQGSLTADMITSSPRSLRSLHRDDSHPNRYNYRNHPLQHFHLARKPSDVLT